MAIYDKASLVLIPSGTKTSKVYSQVPTNGDGDFTFSRSTAATRVNASGNIEKETGNLLLQSNSFSTGWSFANSNVTGGQAGYDGSSDAWLLTKTAGFGRIQRGVSVSGVHTASVYVKAGSLNWCRFLMLPVASGTDPQVYINLSDGSLGSEYNNITATSTSVGNGWYRVTLTFQQAITEFRIYPADANNNVSGTGSIYIQDAQLEQGLVARDYIETTTTAIYGGITDNVPRLDYTDSSCPALLLEPQRTNLITNSEYYDSSAGWEPVGSFTPNVATSPEGLTNASSLDADYLEVRPSVVSGTDYTYSIFVKANTNTTPQIIFTGTTFPSTQANYNLTTGEVTSYTTKSAGIEDYGNGWYRVYATETATATATSSRLRFYCETSYIYGAQFEAGSYATSYIPTYGSAVTRNGDATTKSGLSSILGQSEGTMFAEFDVLNTNEFKHIINQTSSVNSQHIMAYLRNTGAMRYYYGANYVEEGSFPSGHHKIAIAWSGTTASIYRNGSQVSTPSNTNISVTFERANIGNFNGTDQFGDKVQKAMYFPTRLSNEELAALTTI